MLSIWYHSLDKTFAILSISPLSAVFQIILFFLFSESAYAGAVVTANPLATKVGMDIFKKRR
ncbi:MAG: hypothetical protein CM15mP58_18270 [Burkholderiaceae bacterium]|nr:MAG: hypothetical protein CM15mP58_18270 [Burkholderiaceae bacterium]